MNKLFKKEPPLSFEEFMKISRTFTTSDLEARFDSLTKTHLQEKGLKSKSTISHKAILLNSVPLHLKDTPHVWCAFVTKYRHYKKQYKKQANKKTMTFYQYLNSLDKNGKEKQKGQLLLNFRHSLSQI